MNASFKAIVTADIGNFEKNMAKVSSITLKAGAVFSGLSASIIGATAGLKKLAIGAGDTSATINNLSTATSLSTDVIQELTHVAVSSNSSFEGLQKTLGSFQRRLKDVGDEGKESIKTLNNIGVALHDASGATRSMDDVLIDTLSRLGDMPDGLEKAAIGTKLFGRSWNEAALIMSSGSEGIEALRNEAQDLGMVLSGDLLNSADNFATSMDVLSKRIGIIKTRIGAELVPILDGTLKPLIEENILPLVNKFAENLGAWVARFDALDPKIKKTITGVLAFASALGPTLVAVGGIAKILPLVTAGIGALTSPITLVVGAVVAGTALIINNWDKISSYFTSGDGAKLFDSIKKLVSVAVQNVKDNFERIASIVKRIWSQIGDTVMFIWNNTFSNVVNIVSTAINAVSDILEGLAFLLEGDFKGAMNSFKNLFVGIFDGIKNVVLNSVSSIAMGLGKLLEFLKLDKWGTQMQDWAEKIKPAIKEVGVEIAKTTEETKKATSAITEFSETVKDVGVALDVFEKGGLREAITNTASELEKAKERLEGLRTGAIEVTNFHEEIKKAEERVIGLATALDVLTGGRDYNLDLKLPEALLEPTITPKIEIDDKFKADLTEGISVIMVDLNSYITDGVADLMMSISDALVQGEGVMSAIGSSLLGTLGGIMVDLGKMTLMAGNAIEAVKASLVSLQGPIAIAAGVALIAIGSLFSAGARGLGRGMSGGYSGSQSMSNVTPTRGDSEYRGAYRDDFKVEFEIGANKLVGVLDTANQRKNRL